ncbi:hypothetical protein CONPUDRAFT_133662 [Coniophora puteana RWD-64-598 SS2]|uniref:Uncharacterized protein n=1 Tax=Coniophora puteana (strain RWD-64-598) TaxID=741705 RepID=A0A5M3N3T6_CONPW|nr:uncharacterized protein CONPUDRAFT_133662 [Coniophora puteana RWD-64-598 SS2]EIW86016.1 hypothetical protein CONPUDRAFT_133662 [Coniophora puteana RWD-64-598 SS2]
MMSIRVYVLLGRPMTILVVLGMCFAATQIFSITSSIFFFAPGSVYWSEAQLLSIDFCNDDIPTNRDWTYPAYCMTVLAYEVILCALALRHAFKNLSVSAWREPARAAVGLGSIIVRDNLVYFFIVLVSLTLSSVNFVPALSNSIAYVGLEKLMQLTLVTMVGPWMIISLRKSYEKGAAAGIHSSSELTMSFAAAAMPSDDEMEMA